MHYRNRCAKINVVLLIILLVVVAALGVSLMAARQIRRSILTERSLTTGLTAFENKEWAAAVKSFREYLYRTPGDLEVLKKYAEACLLVRPLHSDTVAGAISAYRSILQIDPRDAAAYGKLSMLYTGIGNFEELAAVSRVQLVHDPNDREAQLRLAEALIRLNKTAEARQTLQTLIQKLKALPGKHVEYVRACVQMSSLAAGDDSPQVQETAAGATSSRQGTVTGSANAGPSKTRLDWLNEAVQYAPDSAEAVACRARFYYQQAATTPDTNKQDKAAFLKLARQDLEAADAAGTEDPRIRYLLGVQWLALGEQDRAALELQAADKLPRETLERYFFDISDWTVAKFPLALELARRKGTPGQAASLADETLKSLTEDRHRAQVLPSAIPLYVTGGRVPEARSSLNEYLKILKDLKGAVDPARLAWLTALVEMAEGKPYAAIDTVQPAVSKESSQPDLLRLLAEAYDQTGQAGQAVNVLLQYLRHDPNNPQMRAQLAKQYARLGDWGKASAAAQMAESLGSTDTAIRLLRVWADVNLTVGQLGRVNTERLQALDNELQKLRQANPDQVGIRILQAIIASHLGRSDEVEKQLKLAVEECKEPLRAELQLARYYLGARRTKEAISVCEAACKRHPEVAEPWLLLSDLHVANADYDSARGCLNQGRKTISEPRANRSLSIKLALLELVYGDRAKGTGLLSDLAAQDEKEIYARVLLLGIREVQENPAEVTRLIGELRRAEGESGIWWRLRQASLWLSSNTWSSKQQDITNMLQYCIDADPSLSEPVLLLAGMYTRLGDVKRVEDMYQQGLLRNPSATDIADRLLTLLIRQGRFEDAEKILRQIRIAPGRASDWRVEIARASGDFSRAIDELKLRTSNEPRDASTRIELARLVYQQTKDAEQALRYIKEAEAIDPNSRTLTAVKASILRADGKAAEARQVLDTYVATHNDFAAYWMRAVYLAEQGDLEHAEADYRKLTTFTQNGDAGCELLSNFYAGTRRFDQGVAALEEGVRTYPQNLRLQRRLMQLLLQRAGARDRERAMEILAALEKQLPPDAELMTVRARRFLEENTPETRRSAREVLERAVQLDPTAVSAHLMLIEIMMRQGEYRSAGDYAVRASNANPGNQALRLARGRTELALGYPPMAVKLAREVLSADPNNTDALALLGNGALSSGERNLLDEVLKRTDAALGRDPTSERLLVLWSQVSAALGQSTAAISRLRAHCQSKPSTMALLMLADLYRRAGDVDQADKTIAQAEQLDPESQIVIHARLRLMVAQQRLDALAHIADKYISAKDQDLPTVLEAAATLASLTPDACKNEAVRLYEHAATLSPTLLETHLGLASTLYRTKNTERAKKILEELLQQYPNDVRVLNDLAWILQERDHSYASALDLANRGVKLARDDDLILLSLLDTRGTILANLPDRLVDAKADFGRLVEKSPSDTEQKARALLQLGRVCARLKDLPEAKQHLEEALKIDKKINAFTPAERTEITEITSKSEI